MNEYTIIYFDYEKYHKYKNKVKSIFSDYFLNWDWTKRIHLKSDQIKNVYDTFKIDIHDELIDRNGSSGIWANKYNAVKMVAYEKLDKNEHLPVILIIKGGNTQFTKDVVEYCLKVVGCEVRKVEENDEGSFDEIFKSKLNVKLLSFLNDEDKKKENIKRLFLLKVNYLKDLGQDYSESFINKWLECIDKYGDGKKFNIINNVDDIDDIDNVKKSGFKIVPRKNI